MEEQDSYRNRALKLVKDFSGDKNAGSSMPSLIEVPLSALSFFFRLFTFRKTPAKVDFGSMPKELVSEIEEFEKWARANERDAKRDAILFWILKIPAILCSASAGIFAYFDLKLLPIIAGAIASLCVLIDGLNPRGKLRNVHLKAHHDLRNLQHTISTEWKKVSVGKSTEEECAKRAVEILEEAQKKSKRIAAYIKNAETALDVKSDT